MLLLDIFNYLRLTSQQVLKLDISTAKASHPQLLNQVLKLHIHNYFSLTSQLLKLDIHNCFSLTSITT